MTGHSNSAERICLQAVVALGSLIPITAGLAGAIFGLDVFGHGQSPPPHVDVASHGKYVSGLLLGIGVAYLTTLPRIESQGARFRMLTAIVFIGGLARLLSLVSDGIPSIPMVAGLVMELVIAPSLALWRERVERLCHGSHARP